MKKNKQTTVQQNNTLLGRLFTKELSELGIHATDSGNMKLIRKRLFEVHRNQPDHGEFLMRFFAQREVWVKRLEELPSTVNITELLGELESSPWLTPRFLEVQSGTSTKPSNIGVFIYQEELLDGGRVYVITIMEEDSFPLVSRAEIRASNEYPEPFMSILSSTGYIPFSRENFQTDWDDLDWRFKLGFLALDFLNQKRLQMSMQLSDAAKTNAKKLFQPPYDERCDELTQSVIRRKARCTKLNLPLNKIKPADYDFSVLLPEAIIWPFIFELREGDRPELLVYWNVDHFIMSDDYPAYLAYRALAIESIPVVILGDYPKEIFGTGNSGGPELLPNVTCRFSQLPADPAECELVLDQRLRSDFGKSNNDRLYFFVFEFHKHLNNPLTKERILHDLIIQGANELAEGAFKVLSEVCLGRKYRIDLVFQPTGDTPRITLVELERANLPLFTKSGAPTAYVTHALQQVEDWLRFWHEHPDEIPKTLDPTIVPNGIVILGRSRHLSSDDRRRLLSLNANRRVQLITYDELVERLETYAAWHI
jgi:hypothetical protein